MKYMAILLVSLTAVNTTSSRHDSENSKSEQIASKINPSATHTCSNSPASSRSDKYYCIDPTDITSDSYCLRVDGNEPRHVRAFLNPKAIVNNNATIYKNGHAIFEKPTASTTINCTAQNTWKEGDTVTITQPNQDSFDLQMVINNPASGADVTPITLLANGISANKDNPPKKIYFYRGENDKLVYYVMLSDDNRGLTAVAGVKRIERYYHIEAYLKSENDKCLNLYSPSLDNTGNGAEAYNFYLWTGNASKIACSRSPIDGAQNTSGGAGHDQP